MPIGGARPAMEGLRGGRLGSIFVNQTIEVVEPTDGVREFCQHRVHSKAQFMQSDRRSEFSGNLDGIRALVKEHGGFNAEEKRVGIEYVHERERAHRLLLTICNTLDRSAGAF